MATKAFQKIYTKITQITKATCSLKATGVGYDELATVNGKLAQVVKIAGDEVTLQVFEGTEGIPTNAEVVFLGKAPTIKVSEQLAGRFFNAFGDPIDGGPAIEGEEVEIGGPSVNPVRRKQPSELIATGIAGIDLNNTLVSGQKIPFFADPDQPFNQVMANVALRAETDKIILGGMGMTNDDYLYFKNVFSNAGALDRIVSFMNTTENPPVERLLIPDMALTAAEYFAVNNNEKVLVLLTDMTSYADALAIVSNRMDQIPSKDSMPGSLYSDLAKIYEKAVQFPSGGSITIIAVTTLSGGDITHHRYTCITKSRQIKRFPDASFHQKVPAKQFPRCQICYNGSILHEYHTIHMTPQHIFQTMFNNDDGCSGFFLNFINQFNSRSSRCRI